MQSMYKLNTLRDHQHPFSPHFPIFSLVFPCQPHIASLHSSFTPSFPILIRYHPIRPFFLPFYPSFILPRMPLFFHRSLILPLLLPPIVNQCISPHFSHYLTDTYTASFLFYAFSYPHCLTSHALPLPSLSKQKR